MNHKWLVFVMMALLLCVGLSASADEVTDTLDKATQLYQEGKYAKAVSELNFAIGQINKKLVEQYKETFPEPLSGFTGNEYDAEVASMAVLGGGMSISKGYDHTDGGRVDIDMVSNSPMLSGVMMMFGNAMFLGDGQELVTIQGEKAIRQWSAEDKSGELQIVVDSKVLITVRGSEVSYDTVKAFAEAIDYARLKELVNE